jgi:hypothetical protein
MIKLSKRELIDLARAYMISNTPHSLMRSLRETEAVTRMRRDATPKELNDYYDFLTARADRTELSLPLAYATLIAILLHDKPDPAIAPDSSRLEWGPGVEQSARSVAPVTIATFKFSPKSASTSLIVLPP